MAGRTRVTVTTQKDGSQSSSTVRISNTAAQSISKRRNLGSTISRSLAEWLRSLEWSHWSTFTFSKETSPIGARRSFERFCRQYSKVIQCSYFCVEYGEAFGRTHIHALLYLKGDNTATILWRYWFKRYGRNEILPFLENPEGDAVNYVSNYILKGTVDWDIIGTPKLKI